MKFVTFFVFCVVGLCLGDRMGLNAWKNKQVAAQMQFDANVSDILSTEIK